MKLKDIMITEVKIIEPQDTLLKAHNDMRAAGIRHLLVVSKGTLVGVLSQRDVALHQERTGESIFSSPCDTVSMAMQESVVTASPNEECSFAARRMSSEKLGCLPVMEDGTVVGIVTTSDILATYPA